MYRSCDFASSPFVRKYTCVHNNLHNLVQFFWLIISVSLAVPPTVENAEVSVAVSAYSRRAIATYSTGGIYSILGNSTLVFDCDSGWTSALPQVTGIKCINNKFCQLSFYKEIQCLSGCPLVHLYNVMKQTY